MLLLSEQSALTEENACLRAELVRCAGLQEENNGLRQELDAERIKNEQALARVSSILQRMKERPE